MLAPNASRFRTRRAVLTALAGAGVGLWAVGPRVMAWLAPLERQRIAGLAPFHRLVEAGSASSSGGGPAAAVLLGLEGADRPADAALRARLAADPCAALFRGADPAAGVPVAYFSDVRCPWCRVMETRLAALDLEAGADLQIVPHELPVFGPRSELAARAMIAGDALGQGAALREWLRGARAVIDRAYLAHVAGTLDLAPERLFAAMAAPATESRLAESRALADLFGFAGTPGLVIGGTAVAGAIPAATLARLAAEEREARPCG